MELRPEASISSDTGPAAVFPPSDAAVDNPSGSSVARPLQTTALATSPPSALVHQPTTTDAVMSEPLEPAQVVDANLVQTVVTSSDSDSSPPVTSRTRRLPPRSRGPEVGSDEEEDEDDDEYVEGVSEDEQMAGQYAGLGLSGVEPQARGSSARSEPPHAHAHAHPHPHPRLASPGPSSHCHLPAPPVVEELVLNLPVPSFRIIERPKPPTPSLAAQSYGYNSGAPFVQPPHLMRSVDPIDADLMDQVEYDMDSTDYAWVKIINKFYKRLPSDPDVLSDEFFTIALDRIEKEWWNLTKRIPNPRSQMPSEEEACAICEDAEGENANAIVFCDGCNLAVHQDCYGVPYIPEGQWLCRKCTVSPENPVSCVMCPSEGGAFKQTTTGQWAHLLCAIWIPEAGVGNTVYMEPVDGVEMITKQRWKLKCSLCKKPRGACIQCDNKSCYTAFHPTCAREAGLLGSMKTYGDTGGVLKAYCEKHIPPAIKAANDTKLTTHAANKSKKSARAHAKRYEVPPPLLPEIILRSVTDYLKRMPGVKKRELVEKIGKYWSLKRESRRGAPLLKRLHLEPWTAADLANQKTEEEKEQQLLYLSRTRQDLEQVRMLNGLVLKREKYKKQQVEAIIDCLRPFLHPFEERMQNIVETLREFDKKSLFDKPVNTTDFPDYPTIIANPMSFSVIDNKIYDNAYLGFSNFEADVLLVASNAMTYNPPTNAVHKIAVKMLELVTPLLADLKRQVWEESEIAQTLIPLRVKWAEIHTGTGDQTPPFPEEAVTEPWTREGQPIDTLAPSAAHLATLTEKIPGSDETWLQSIFAYKYELAEELQASAPPAEGAAPAAEQTDSTPVQTKTTRIRTKKTQIAPAAVEPTRQSSRKRPRGADEPVDVQSVDETDSRATTVDTDGDDFVPEFHRPVVLPEGATRRRSGAGPRPNNAAAANAQKDKPKKEKAPTRREDTRKLTLPAHFVPKVKVPRRQPKCKMSKNSATYVEGEASRSDAAPYTVAGDESDLSSLSEHASEVESESEPEPSDEILEIQPRPIRLNLAQSEDDGDNESESDEEEPEVLSTRRRGPPPTYSTGGFRRITPALATTARPPSASSSRSSRQTRPSPAPSPVFPRHARPAPKKSGLRQHFEAEAADADSESEEDAKEEDSLFGGSMGNEDQVEQEVAYKPRPSSARQPAAGSFASGSRASQRGVPSASTPRTTFRPIKAAPAPTPTSTLRQPIDETHPKTRSTPSSSQQLPPSMAARRTSGRVNVPIPSTARSKVAVEAPPAVARRSTPVASSSKTVPSPKVSRNPRNVPIPTTARPSRLRGRLRSPTPPADGSEDDAQEEVHEISESEVAVEDLDEQMAAESEGDEVVQSAEEVQPVKAAPRSKARTSNVAQRRTVLARMDSPPPVEASSSSASALAPPAPPAAKRAKTYARRSSAAYSLPPAPLVEPEQSEEVYDDKGRPKRHLKKPTRLRSATPIEFPPSPPPPLKSNKRKAPKAEETTERPSRRVKQEFQAEKGKSWLPAGEVSSDEEEMDSQFQHGSIVWAQSASYPWFPAEVVVPCEIDHEDEDETEVPKDLHDRYKRARAKWAEAGGKESHRPFIVHYWDEARVWDVVLRKNLADLREQDAEDTYYLLKQPHKSFKTQQKHIVKAYEAACKSIGSDEEAAIPKFFKAIRKDFASVIDASSRKKASAQKSKKAAPRAASALSTKAEEEKAVNLPPPSTEGASVPPPELESVEPSTSSALEPPADMEGIEPAVDDPARSAEPSDSSGTPIVDDPAVEAPSDGPPPPKRARKGRFSTASTGARSSPPPPPPLVSASRNKGKGRASGVNMPLFATEESKAPAAVVEPSQAAESSSAPGRRASRRQSTQM